jgi:broad specificity phosphatase PhoE
MQLYLVRHGESFNNALKKDVARVCDPPLTEKGEKQADLVGAHLGSAGVSPEQMGSAGDVQNQDGYGINRIFCSAMLRTLQTTAPIGKALGIDPEIWLDVHEEGGIWLTEADGTVGYPGITRSEIEDRFPGFVIPDTITESGWWNRPIETQEQWKARAARVAKTLHEQHADTDDRIAIVNHGGFANDLLHALFQNAELDEIYFSHQNTAITRIDFEDGGHVRMRYMNRVNHLPMELVS